METTGLDDLCLGFLRREVVPALGCTDPVAIALASATARKILGRDPDRIEVSLSANMLKNAMAVGIPGTGASGIDLAAALGAVGGNPGAGLRVLQDAAPSDVELARSIAGRVVVSLKDTSEVLYIEVTLRSRDDAARVVIEGDYTRITVAELNGASLAPPGAGSGAPAGGAGNDVSGGPGSPLPDLRVEDLFRFASAVPAGSIAFMLEAATMNAALSEEGLRNDYGLGVGKVLRESLGQGLMSADVAAMAAIETAAAVDARMAGCSLPAMTNSGSGNQGITATVPVVVVARELGSGDEALARALALSHLVAIHVRRHFDRLSPMCGTIPAGMGAACGMVLLLGGNYGNVVACIANMAGDLSGMACDGAKSSCALKASSSVQSAVKSAVLAMRGIRVAGRVGIVDDDVETIIDNLGRLGSEGMRRADALILEMMTAPRAVPPPDPAGAVPDGIA